MRDHRLGTSSAGESSRDFIFLWRWIIPYDLLVRMTPAYTVRPTIDQTMVR